MSNCNQCQTISRDTFCPKGPFRCFVAFKKGKGSFSFSTSLYAMLCCCLRHLQGTKQHPNFEWSRVGRGWGWILIVLFSEATPFEDNVSTILSWIVISGLIKDGVISRGQRLRLLTLTEPLIIPDAKKSSYPVFSIYIVSLILLSYLFEAKSGSNSEVSADSLDDYMSSLGTTMDKTSRSQIRRKVFDLKKVLFNSQKSFFKSPSQIIRVIKLLTPPLSYASLHSPIFLNDRQY